MSVWAPGSEMWERRRSRDPELCRERSGRGREGERKGGREGGRERGREGARERGREEGREREREGRNVMRDEEHHKLVSISPVLYLQCRHVVCIMKTQSKD